MRDIEAYLKEVAKRNKKVPPRVGLPPRYKEYSDIAKTFKDERAVHLMNIFAYRYRLARQFSGVHALGIGKSLEGYNAIEAVFLANAALELLCECSKTIGGARYQKIGQVLISDKRLADRLRKNIKLRELPNLSAKIENRQSKSGNSQRISHSKIEIFFTTQSDDVSPIAYMLRNHFTHGSITANTIGLNRKSFRDDLWSLADTVLNMCDRVWEYVLDLMGRLNQKNPKLVLSSKRVTLSVRRG